MIDEEQLGRPQTMATRKKIAKSMTGSGNSQWKDGRRAYRRIAGAREGDGTLIHHKNGDRTDNSRANLVKISKENRGKHDAIHHRENSFKKSGGTKMGSHTKRSHPDRWG